MKMRLMLVVLGISLSSFGESPAKPILEATDCDPDLYTIQFTLAKLNDDFKMGQAWSDTNSINSATSYMAPATTSEIIQSGVTADTTPILPDNGIAEQIRLSNPSYSNFSTVHVAPNEEFSAPNEIVSGMFDTKHGTLRNLLIKFMDREINVDGIAVSNSKWQCIVIGGSIDKDGKEQNYALLIKSYPPKK